MQSPLTSTQFRLFKFIISLLPRKARISLLYFRRFFRWPNLSKPRSFNEKVQWRKINDRNPLLTIAADKIRSKAYVESKSKEIHIPKVYWSGRNIRELDVSHMPEQFVIKANHGSRMNFFVKDKNLLDIEYLCKLTEKWLNHDTAHILDEWAYKNIERNIFVEEMLYSENGESPSDYKFFVFHGEVKLIQVDSDRFTSHKRTLFDKEWRRLELEFSHPIDSKIKSPPRNLKKMLRIAEQLGSDFDFMRVDLYTVNDKVYFGELTVYPGAGYEPFPTFDFDLELGDFWDSNLLRDSR